ncbi:MAG TPA: hypothetical protein VGZ32_04030 [Actinocrinis sp.]|jgi:hypothetical protein|uniref:hypothetical protein n=1 Tax=Actinocrinis sp. TaxID=1920516 RepID=UPI002DDD43C9|nr:hypothetical protein [Actinocrinis sp.]HEV3169478.1 hypothetical protein [Actinocrinis sp.]
MYKRVFWIALGASVGVLVVTKGAKTLRKFSPSGLADSASGLPGALSGSVRGFLDDVQYAAAEREMELYRALGMDSPDPDGPHDR